MKTTLHEDDIIRSKDAELPEDDWPEFTLTQCQIIDPQEGTYVSLFKADTNNPLAISGRLEPVLREYSSLLSNRHSLPQYIELTAVRTYAYGQDENGEIALWAAGKCGWYLLRPSRSYKKTYSSTLEAVKALYFVTDFHVETRTKVRKSRDVSILQLFRAYAQEPIHQCIDADSAQAIYEGHAEFLTKAMEKEDIKAAVRWLSTPIYQHLKDIVVETFDNDKEEQELVSSGRPPTHGSLRPRGAEFSMKAKGRRNSEKMSHEHTAGVKRKRVTSIHEQNDRKDESPDVEMTLPELSTISNQEDKHNLLPFREVRDDEGIPRLAGSLNIAEHDLPSSKPQGPGDTWTCIFDGCVHRVYGASSPQNRELIKEHFQNHAVESQSQIDLIFKEERPYLPVSNLVKRIRELASNQHSLPIFETESNLPARIQRRY